MSTIIQDTPISGKQMAFGGPSIHKLWSMEWMKEALDFVEGGEGLREVARIYHVLVETLRCQVTGAVSINCRPGPGTVLTKVEDAVAKYLVTMCDMGYGLTRDIVMNLAYRIVEKSGRKHPFTGKSAGRLWFEGFVR